MPAIVSAQAFIAEDFGLFKKQGLDVTFVPTNAGVNTMAALIGGSLDIGFGDAAGVSSAHVRGLPLAFFAPGMMDTKQTPILSIIVKADGPLHRGRDFNGKTIAVSALKSMSTITASAWIDRDGGDSKSVHFIEYPIAQMPAAVANGTVSGAFPPEPFITSAIESGAVRDVLVDKGVQNFMISGWIANTAWITNNRDTAVKFIAAIREAGEIINRRPLPPEVAASLAKYTKIPAPVIGRLMFMPKNADTLSDSALQPLIDAAAKYGVIERTFPAADIIDRP